MSQIHPDFRQRRHSRIPAARGLYDFANEHDACGVGLVANLDNVPSHEIVRMGETVLERLMHRGAAGGDPDTGDGAGLLLGIPDEFFRRTVDFALPGSGRYGVAMVFGSPEYDAMLESFVRAEGATVLGCRPVPTDPAAIGRLARESCPEIRQIFVAAAEGWDRDAFERKLFVIRRQVEKAVSAEEYYFCSFSSRSIVYKGLLLAPQLGRFYPDLRSSDFKSPLALAHQRYSTNTFPTWQLAHPFRYLAHNGEINTLRGNLNLLRSREPFFRSELFGDDLAKLLPLIGPGQSDSGSLDNMLELLVACGRRLEHAMLMLIPQAWGAKYHLGRDVRGFFEYHSALMEPWDGPAAVAFSDGVNAGAMLDRNGLRPARYTLTRDRIFVLASETGVLDFPPEIVVRKGRLAPGEMIFCDLVNHRLIENAELKNAVARQQPYRRWVEENQLPVNGLFSTLTPSVPLSDLRTRQQVFGYTAEDLELIVRPMAKTGHEPIGSMGNDAALAVLSTQNPGVFNYFKQLFAQVTNPPIDPIREELVMSLTTYLGNRGNILAEIPEHARLIKLKRPILTDAELNALRRIQDPKFRSATLCCEFPAGGSGAALAAALERLATQAVQAVKAGCGIVILSDRDIADGNAPIPILLAVGAVNRALSAAGVRPETGLIAESGEVREIMHYALLLGYGATAVNPYLVLSTVSAMCASGELELDAVTALGNYIQAVDKGLLKVMSKMGISTLRSYRSAQIFEAVGLGQEVIEHYFPGTASRVGGATLDDLAAECAARHRQARLAKLSNLLAAGGQYRFRRDTEAHLWSPESLTAFRLAVRENNPGRYREYADMINRQERHLNTLRGLFEFVETAPVPLEEVESAESIIRRFVSGAMSLGSLSPEAHETIAIAMNRLGAMSNSGEGGEDPDRAVPNARGEARASAIRQVASGRFGVTIDYLRGAKELQIKMAQGAKPGEGGQLPGYKVDDFVARIRHSIPHVTLISPPPHHDIYSIEDLAQLIYDLRCANPEARVSVKLVSEIGVGTIAAGVVKAHADMVLISGHDGGTGASPLTSIKHAGLPWELGLAEAQQTLCANHLRSHVRLQVDGQLKTGRDVIIGALLGAEEFGFATTILVCLGCVMMRKCHDNSCPAGVATQDPALRRKFDGKPEYIENFLRFVAEEVRGYLARLGLRSLDEAVGRTDLLRTNRAIDFFKARHLDFSRILAGAGNGIQRFDPAAGPLGTSENYDEQQLLPALADALDNGKAVQLSRRIANSDRAAGTRLAGEIARRHGAAGLPEGTIRVDFTGCAGQSFGAFLAPGVTFTLEGEANDFVGKGLSGGTIVIRVPRTAGYSAAGNVIAGNVIGYGATAGAIFLNGQAGERFAVRNSGATLVVEGVGDHGCEYMTGGRVVVLGRAGINFAAGMTGGLAYVLDEAGDFDLYCNPDSVDLEPVVRGSADERELLGLLERHRALTGSVRAEAVLADWENVRGKFVKVFPVEYRHALAVAAERAAGK